MLLKNTGPTPIDVGGRMLACGETGDLDPTDPTVTEHLTFGRLTAVQDGTTAARSKAAKPTATKES